MKPAKRKIPYEVSATGLILTRCKIFGCTIGGWQCVNCSAFDSKDMKNHVVTCNRTNMEHTTSYKMSTKNDYYKRNRDAILERRAELRAKRAKR